MINVVLRVRKAGKIFPKRQLQRFIRIIPHTQPKRTKILYEYKKKYLHIVGHRQNAINKKSFISKLC